MVRSVIHSTVRTTVEEVQKKNLPESHSWIYGRGRDEVIQFHPESNEYDDGLAKTRN